MKIEKKHFFSKTVLNAWVCAHFLKKLPILYCFLAKNLKSYNQKENIPSE